VEEKKMIRLKMYAAASVLGLASFAVMPSLADTWNKKTILTVNEPIQVPGKVLQPGKYVMKLMDSPSNRHVVQIFNEAENELQTTILAIPNYRLQPTGNTEFQWWETPAGQPKALRAWFYPGDNFGQEFAYPKDMSVQIATNNNAPVPTTYSQSTEDLSTARVGAVDKSGAESDLNKDYQKQETQVAENTPPPAPEPQATAPAPAPEPTPAPVESTRARTELPRTASPFPMVAMAGLLALGASMAVRAIAKRAS
jgi:hypothetical protein